MMETHQNYMQRALKLAEQGRYTASPNPMVGCLIVKQDKIIGEGFHLRTGEAHAEVHALKQAGGQANGATAYITMEPCCHHGKTPPCTDALIQAGIKKAVIAIEDPNPLVAGKGIAALKKAGINVETGIEKNTARQLNEIFFHYMKYRTPFVISKWAMSLDGKIVTAAEDSRIISSAASQHDVHLLRSQVDAILIGSRTAKNDNPLLTVRVNSHQEIKQPLRIVLSSNGDLPLDLKLFDTSLPGKTIIAVTEQTDSPNRHALSKKGIEILTTKTSQNGLVDLPDLLIKLGKRHITSLLVEGGRQIHDSFFHQELVNKVQAYIAPVIISTLNKKKPLKKMNLLNSGDDYLVTAYIGE